MKIKTVCELTGLSDRTIRYYIEENLIAPEYTENYLGRRSYDFSESDADDLKHIAILRKFDFTIEEIRAIINDAEASKDIIREVISRTEKSVSEGSRRLSALSGIRTDKTYTIAELACELSKPSLDLPVRAEKPKIRFGKIIFSVFRAIIVLLPVIISALTLIGGIHHYYYWVIDFSKLAVLFALLLPSVVLFVISKFRFKGKTAVICILIVLCIASLPFNVIYSLMTIPKSETSNIRSYRDFDVNCYVGGNTYFNQFFPLFLTDTEMSSDQDGKREWYNVSNVSYYYRFDDFIDPNYDVFVELTLGAGDYEKEVARAEKVFEELREKMKSEYADDDAYRFVRFKMKRFDFLMIYRTWSNGNRPFHEAPNDYDYLIFAYDDSEKIVRYIRCYSMDYELERPHYMQLDW